ncbi:MAG: tetratricopeptide repeat protein [Alphaproteobacteria bacterium]
MAEAVDTGRRIFVSFSSQDRETVQGLVSALTQAGHSVWWDEALETRPETGPEGYAGQIEAAIMDAHVVIVVWSGDAVRSKWVWPEAAKADAAGKVLGVRLDDFPPEEIPLPFNRLHCRPLGDLPRILADISGLKPHVPRDAATPATARYAAQFHTPFLGHKIQALPKAARFTAPSELRQARNRVVPYIDGAGMKADMADWCRTAHPNGNVAARLVFGPGGAGKTRMMIDLARELRGEGWSAGFLEAPVRDTDACRDLHGAALAELLAGRPWHGHTDRGLLLVMDYAEGRAERVKDLSQRLRDLAAARAETGDGRARPLRLVLLARDAEWFERLDHGPTDILFREAGGAPAIQPMRVLTGAGLAGQDGGAQEQDGGAEAADPERRLALFDASWQAFRQRVEAMGYPPADDPDAAFRARIATQPQFARPLAVQLAALLHLAARPPESSVPGASAMAPGEDTAKLLKQVLSLEKAYWARALDDAGKDRLDAVERGLAQVTLVGGVDTEDHARALLAADAFHGDALKAPRANKAVFEDLRRLYGAGAQGLAPLEPDILGEHLVAGLADAHHAVAACLDHPGPQAAQIRERVITVLQRASQADPHGSACVRAVETVMGTSLVPRLGEMIEETMTVLAGTEGRLAAVLTDRADTLEADVALRMMDALPRFHTGLVHFAAAVTSRCVIAARMRVQGSDDSESARGNLARSLSRLGGWLSHLARGESARGDLAASLSNLGVRLSHLGRREAALTAEEEAVALYRRLAADTPAAFEPDLARSLSNLGIYLSALGRREAALTATQEAVAIRRRLAAANPAAFEPNLAGSLSNLGVRLSELGRREAALTATQEAVALYRRLAADTPAAFEPDLARSLRGLADLCLAPLGRTGEALARAVEGLGLILPHAEALPDAFHDLAKGLGNSVEGLLSEGGAPGGPPLSQDPGPLLARLAALYDDPPAEDE